MNGTQRVLIIIAVIYFGFNLTGCADFLIDDTMDFDDRLTLSEPPMLLPDDAPFPDVGYTYDNYYYRQRYSTMERDNGYAPIQMEIAKREPRTGPLPMPTVNEEVPFANARKSNLEGATLAGIN